MIRSLWDYFKGMRKGSHQTFVEQQVDIGTAVLEMMDRAAITEQEVFVTIKVGDAQETMVCRGRGDAVTQDLYQIVSRVRKYWIKCWRKELEAAGIPKTDEIWQGIELKLDRMGRQERKNKATDSGEG